MPYITTWEADGVYRVFSGEINAEQILRSNFELQRHPDFMKIHYVLNDFTPVTGHSLTSSHTNTYAETDEIIAGTKGSLKIALVVPNEIFVPVAQAYIEQMSDKIFDCQLFRLLQEARAWVEVP